MPAAQTIEALPLQQGQILDQPTFHRRYLEAPPNLRAELIGGVVYIMPSPVSLDHGSRLCQVDRWLWVFQESSVAVRISADTTTILGPRSEPQPDLQLRILQEYGGSSGRTEDGYAAGPPELLAEIAVSTASIDLNQKKRDYEQAGVQEYIVVLPSEVRWFQRVEGQYQPLLPGEDGIFRSIIFPGLWLDPAALLAGDMKRLRQVARQGIRSPEHRAWTREIKTRKTTAH
ncbi:MAG TPA: Uma2 family endonuclease [Armatimonadota bacterium]|nr:Uma2 family endonuclease [Armatimonadota bacterium]